MADDPSNPFYSRTYRPPPPRTPKPGEPIWALQREEWIVSCELRDLGECVGVETQLFCDGTFDAARMFADRAHALIHAEKLYGDMLRKVGDGLPARAWFRGRRMASISTADVRAFVADMQAGGYANATINRALSA